MPFMVLFTLVKIQMYLNVKTSLDFDWQFACHREAKNVTAIKQWWKMIKLS